MFYTEKDKKAVNECFVVAHQRIGELSRDVVEAEMRIKKLETTVKGLEAAYDVLLKAAHGIKKDGQPRAKPGRKAK